MNTKDYLGKICTVYNRYLFAVPVRGYITGRSDKDGAYRVQFYEDGGKNVTKHSGSYFFPQEVQM